MKVKVTVFLVFLAMGLTSCGASSGGGTSSSQIDAVKKDASKKEVANSDELSEAELRRVVFDETEIGWMASHPMYYAEIGMTSAMMMMESMGVEGSADEVKEMRQMLAYTNAQAKKMNIGDKVWDKIVKSTPLPRLKEMYAVINADPVQRCVTAVKKEFLLLYDNPVAYLKKANKEDPFGQLTEKQQMSINEYISREGKFLKKLGAQMAYLAALSSAYFLHTSIEMGPEVDENEIKDTKDKLEELKTQLKDEAACLSRIAKQVEMKQFRTEFADVLRLCSPDDAEAYWSYSTSAEYHEFQEVAWESYYSVAAGEFRKSMGL